MKRHELNGWKGWSVLAVAGAITWAQAAAPPVPRQFTMQGVTTGYSSPVSIGVRFFDASSGGTNLWSETHSSVALTSDGVFSLNVGSQTVGGIPDSAFAGSEVWVELTFNSTDIWPRTQLLAVPFALKSIYAEQLVKPDSMDAVLTTESDGDVRVTTRILSPVYASTSPFIMEAPAGTERARIDDATGNFGIGTTAPAYKLHVVNSSTSGRAVVGSATATTGLSYGGYFETFSTGSRGVAGFAHATSGNSSGVYGYSASETDGRGVRGVAAGTAQTGTSTGVWGESSCGEGYGVKGLALATTGANYGVYGASSSTNGTGVWGSGGKYGVYGTAPGTGIYGETSGFAGVQGKSSDDSGIAYGGLFQSASTDGRGVAGVAYAETGTNFGVHGRTESTEGIGVYGLANAWTGVNYGVYGINQSTEGIGVYGVATTPEGDNFGIYGKSYSQDGTGVYGEAPYLGGHFVRTGTGFGVAVYGHDSSASSAGYGVWGRGDGTGSVGVLGSAEATTGDTFGVYGYSSSSSGVGVLGFATKSSGTIYGVYGITNSSTDWGGYFDRLHASYASATVKAFQIDHPLDPENKYLCHSSVESPDMMNIYNGVVEVDARGEAWVELPGYFEALNRDFRYQLTAIGSAMPELHIAQEIDGNRFMIAGGTPAARVSWQVTGVRQDPIANWLRIEVETVKPQEERGKYLVPEAYGLPLQQGVHYRAMPERVTERVEARTSSQSIVGTR